jgi:F-type H+-transporting ATPase subunit epsilon
MAHTIRCKLITPEDRVIDAEILRANVPLHDGQTGVMHRTGALVAKLGFGQLRIDFPQGESKSWFIDGGFAQNVENEITILASGAIPVDELDAAEAKAELAEAIARKPADPSEMDRITKARSRARAKVALAR